jgi:DNA-binding XRE family transcriptional regulator
VPTNIKAIIKKLPKADREKIRRRTKQLIAEELTLQELRRARELTQARMAKSLGVAQKLISAIERRTDMHISTLRRAIEAMGGDLYLVARFPDRAPVILSGIESIE